MQLHTMGVRRFTTGGASFKMAAKFFAQSTTLFLLILICLTHAAEENQLTNKDQRPIIKHGKGGDLRVKRDLTTSEPEKPVSTSRATRVIQYNGWHPVNLNNPLNNEPTIAYKPPTLQKVQFIGEQSKTKPLYPIVPENPTVVVVRKEKSNPEIDKVYGTEKVEYAHIKPKSKMMLGFKPEGNKPVLKFVRRLDNVKESFPSKRSHSNPYEYFLPHGGQPRYDFSNLNLSSLFGSNRRFDLDPSSLLQIFPSNDQPDDNKNVASSRGIPSSQITPQQLLQARMHLARLPLLTPLQGLFGSFTQIPLHNKKRTTPIHGDSAIEVVTSPNWKQDQIDHLQHEPSEQVKSVLFTRSKQIIDRSDGLSFEEEEDDPFDEFRIIPRKSRLSSRRLKAKKPSKSITAGSLSELLQIFNHINVTEPPPTPTTTPPPVTIMKGFRYTKPTEAPSTTTTTRPTTTKRFKLPTAFRYIYTQQPNQYIQNIHPHQQQQSQSHFLRQILTTTTTPKPTTPGKITISPVRRRYTKPIQGIPSVVFDRVAETNSLDGYLFSDSEPSPEFSRSESKTKVVRRVNNAITSLPSSKSLTSKRVSVKLIGEEQKKDDIKHTKNSEPLQNDFEVIYTNMAPLIKNRRTTTTTTTPEPLEHAQEPSFAIIEGHSKVRVFRGNTISTTQPTPKIDILTSTPSTLLTLSTPDVSSTRMDENSSNNDNAQVTSEQNVSESFYSYGDGRFPEYNDYPREGALDDRSVTAIRLIPGHDYEYTYENDPSYSLHKLWLPNENPPTSNSEVDVDFTVSDLFDDYSLPGESRTPPTTPPHLHFITQMHRSMPTTANALPTTWQDVSHSSTPSRTTTSPLVSESSALDSNSGNGKSGSEHSVTTNDSATITELLITQPFDDSQSTNL